MQWLRVSLFAQAILAGYFQLFQWVPLGAWNNQCPSNNCDPNIGLGALSVPGYLPLGVLALQGRLPVQDPTITVS